MMMNPEFRRNLWLEMTTYRLIGMPAVLAAVFVLVAALSPEHGRATLGPAALIIYGALVLLWGTRQASECVVIEIRDRTWDNQRMSGIAPWTMTWGKLLGSTIFPWYGGLLCLLVYAIFTASDPTVRTVRVAALFLSVGLLAHAAALLSSMQMMMKERRYNRSQTSAFLVLGVLFAGPFLSAGLATTQDVVWMGMVFRITDFSILSVQLFLVWAVLGIYRLMRQELQMKQGSLAWLAFAIFIALYAAGFQNAADSGERSFGRFIMAYFMLALTSYLMAFGERKDPVAFRKLLSAMGRAKWSDAAMYLPCWAVTLLPVMIAACGAAFFGASVPDKAMAPANMRLFVAASFFFLLRDLGLMLFLNLARDRKRADMILLLNLLLLYGVIPGILSAVQFEKATFLFWPRWDTVPLPGLLAAAVEAAVVLVLLMRRWRGLYPAAPTAG